VCGTASESTITGLIYSVQKALTLVEINALIYYNIKSYLTRRTVFQSTPSLNLSTAVMIDVPLV
jgi:hypothetical protein